MANIFGIDRPTNTITLGTTGTTINIASHTASLSLGLDASKNLESVDLSGVYQPLDVVLTDLAALGVVADNEFIVGTGAGVYAHESGATARTSIGLGNVENTQLSTWAGTTNITTLGTIGTGVWEGTSIAVGYTDAKCVAVWPDTYTADQNLLEASSPTFAGLNLTGNVTLSSGASWILLHDSGTNVGHYLLSCDTTESSGYGEFSIWRCTGAADGCALGDNPPILWADSSLNIYFSKNINLTVNTVRTLGQSDGPLLTFDAPNNYLGITECKVGIGGTPTRELHIFSEDNIGLQMTADSDGTPRDWHLDVSATTGAFRIVETDVAIWLSIEETTGLATFTGAISSGTLTIHPSGQTNDTDVSGINTLFLDLDGDANALISGFTGGVDGQVLRIAVIDHTKTITLQHVTDGGGASEQDLYLCDDSDETLDDFGGWVLICNGSHWYNCGHAKHVA